MRVVFMGTPAAAVPTLERLVIAGHDVAAVYTQPDRPAGRGKQLAMSPVKGSATRLGIPVYQPTRIKTAEAVEEFRSHEADAAIVVAYGRILPPAFLYAFRFGAINVHFSLLPKYRGAAPVNWAIANGEENTGVTTMQMDEGLDTGPILLQSEIAIDDSDTAIDVTNTLAGLGAELLLETLAKIGSLKPIKQDDERASYAPLLNKSDGAIDWSMSAVEIRNRVRGFQPFPTSFTYLDGKKLTIWNCIGGPPTDVKPGAVIETAKGELGIACGGNTSLIVTELQIEGKRRVPAAEFLNGHRISPGDILVSPA